MSNTTIPNPLFPSEVYINHHIYFCTDVAAMDSFSQGLQPIYCVSTLWFTFSNYDHGGWRRSLSWISLASSGVNTFCKEKSKHLFSFLLLLIIHSCTLYFSFHVEQGKCKTYWNQAGGVSWEENKIKIYGQSQTVS